MHDHWPKDLHNASGLTTGISAPRPAIGEMIGKSRLAMEHVDFKQRPGEEYRQLRMVTILASLLGISILFAFGLNTDEVLPTIGITPMFFSATMGVLTLTGMLRSPRIVAPIDLMMAALLFCFMVPRCVASMYLSSHAKLIFAPRSFVSLKANSWDQDDGLTMLGTYGTSTMILNLYDDALFRSR
jgi:hypothetical protein